MDYYHTSKMEEGKQFNINIYKENKEGIENASNRAEAYIILANEELNNKNRDILLDLKELQSQHEIQTEENERMEVTIVNQRGMLHNLHASNKLEGSLTIEYEKLNKDYSNQIEDLCIYSDKNDTLFTNYFMYFIIALLVQSSLGIIDIYAFITVVVNLSSLFYITHHFHGQENSLESICKSHDSLRKLVDSEIKRIKNDISETKRGTDHISNFIDSI